jgi:hypothetical protein
MTNVRTGHGLPPSPVRWDRWDKPHEHGHLLQRAHPRQPITRRYKVTRYHHPALPRYRRTMHVATHALRSDVSSTARDWLRFIKHFENN